MPSWLGYDPLLGPYYLVTTWDAGFIGTHGGNSGYILSSLSQHLDRFLTECLRVNEAVCGKR